MRKFLGHVGAVLSAAAAVGVLSVLQPVTDARATDYGLTIPDPGFDLPGSLSLMV